MITAVIPARGGSKRIPGKNIKEFHGKPIIAWSIEAANKCGCFDYVMVSTDDRKIADIAIEYGAEVPFLRPPSISDDFTPTSPVIAHAISWLNNKGLKPEPVCCIYATAPFISSDDISLGLKMLQQSDASYVFTVTSYAFPIQRAVRITSTGRVEMYNRKFLSSRSQDLDEAYHDAGQFYWGRTKAWLGAKDLFTPDSVPLILPRHKVQDIDTYEDWKYAEALFEIEENRFNK